MPRPIQLSTAAAIMPTVSCRRARPVVAVGGDVDLGLDVVVDVVVAEVVGVGADDAVAPPDVGHAEREEHGDDRQDDDVPHRARSSPASWDSGIHTAAT